jgi:2-methylisocitrate lyase-like PEP mutase family enzyme
MRSLLKEKDYVFSIGIHNAMQAMIVEKAGLDFVYMGGYDTSLALFGLPDVGLLTETEMVFNARNIAKSVNIPVIADADTGYGNAINVIRTVEDYEAAGVAGIHIEDQAIPKRCAHLAGKTIIPIEEAAGKIKAALDARKDKDFLIIARTDAATATGGGFEEALKRGKAYARVGADMVLCEFPSIDIEYSRKFADEMHKEFPDLPLFFNYWSNFKWYDTPIKFSEIAKIGYKAINVSLVAIRVSMQAVWDYAVDIKKREEGTEFDLEKRSIGHPMEDLNKFVGIPKIEELELKYMANEELRKKCQGSMG